MAVGLKCSVENNRAVAGRHAEAGWEKINNLVSESKWGVRMGEAGKRALPDFCILVAD